MKKGKEIKDKLVRVDEDRHKKAKLIATMEGKSIKDLIHELIDEKAKK